MLERESNHWRSRYAIASKKQILILESKIKNIFSVKQKNDKLSVYLGRIIYHRNNFCGKYSFIQIILFIVYLLHSLKNNAHCFYDFLFWKSYWPEAPKRWLHISLFSLQVGSKDILFHCPSVNKQQRKYQKYMWK